MSASVPAPTVSAIVIAHNAARLLPTLLDSLLAQTHPPDEIVVVDNGSTDGTAEAARGRSRVRCLSSPHNLGAAAARNLGTRESQGDVLAFIDDDATAHPDWIAEGLAALGRHPQWGAAGSLLYFDPNRAVVNGCGARLNRSLFGMDFGLGQPASSFDTDEHEVAYVMSNGLFVRRDAARRVGDWDPVLFVYYEDVDFCLRVRLTGRGVGIAPRAVLYHRISKGEHEAYGRLYLSERHRLRLALKYLDGAPLRRWLRREGGLRLLLWRDRGRAWAYNLRHGASLLRFRRRHPAPLRAAVLEAWMDDAWGLPQLPAHNLRSVVGEAGGEVVARDHGQSWTYGVYPPEPNAGETIQWLDGESAIDFVLSGGSRGLRARLYADERTVGRDARLVVQDASGATRWSTIARLQAPGWSELDWSCVLPAGRYRLGVRGEPARVASTAGPRRLLLAYESFRFRVSA